MSTIRLRDPCPLNVLLIVGAMVLSYADRRAGANGPETPKYEGRCTSSGCHEEFTKRSFVHSPIEAGACDACHLAALGAEHKFRLTASGAALCTQCHEEDGFQEKIVHGPVAQGQCDACHDPHGGKTQGLLTADTIGALCGECHEDVLEGLSFIHGPAAVGQCTACHAPHTSKQPKLLKAEDRELCVECHTEILDRTASPKQVHSPAESGCVSCHRPHGAANKMMLSSTPPGICLDCHDSIAERLETARYRHSPVTAGRACLTCHDAHASSTPGLVLAASSMELCLSCHDKEIETPGGALVNLAAHLQNHPNHHGPIQSGDCTACHEAHGGEHAMILSRSFPSRFYAPYGPDRYSLCFECHDAAGFEDPQTDDATEFRNGTRNLHFVHVNKPFKGRTCRACHDPHASRNPKHIVERAAFGKWSIPLNFQLTPTGGSCQPGCHQPYRYDRGQPAINVTVR